MLLCVSTQLFSTEATLPELLPGAVYSFSRGNICRILCGLVDWTLFFVSIMITGRLCY